MTNREVYVVKSILQIGDNVGLDIIENRLCLRNLQKDKIMCVELDVDDSLAILVYLTETIIGKLCKEKEDIYQEIVNIYNKIDKIIEEIEQPKEYRYYAEAEAEINSIYRRLNYLNSEIEHLVRRYNSIKSEIDEMKRIKNGLMHIMSNHNISITQNIVIL